MKRRICYISGTRADFGLMQSTLQLIHNQPDLCLDVIATGMHLSEDFGLTVNEIAAAELNLRARISVPLFPASGATMARNISRMIAGFVDEFERDRPDILLLLGDRGEMLAGAIAGIHLNVPVVHIHGGERSGTVDEPVRHAISKLAHYHFVATERSKERLIRMGESVESIFVTGAPGLDGLSALASHSRRQLCAKAGFDPERPVALMVFHPVLQEADDAEESVRLIIDCLYKMGIQVLALMPNSDAGSGAIRRVLLGKSLEKNIRVETHLNRSVFASWMATCDLMIGNSSAGIIEAASFGTPVVNVGVRQNLRERNTNTVDVSLEPVEIQKALEMMLKHGRFAIANVYGDGHAGERITSLLSSLLLSPELLAKTNAY